MTDSPHDHVVRVGTLDDARAVLRSRTMRQALYDEGAVVMADCLLDLHGTEHRDRRCLENRLFRRETFEFYEEDLLPSAIVDAMAPMMERGRGDLIPIGYRTVMHLTALIAGVDVFEGGDDALEMVVKQFARGATAVHATGDRATLKREVDDAMNVFDELFLRPSIDRRAALIRAVDQEGASVELLPRDVLTTLLRNVDRLELPDDVIRREVAFYLQAGGHSTANALTHTLDELWSCGDSNLVERAATDRRFLQRCVHESLRLHPASPVAWRRALSDCELPSGQTAREGSLVVVDLEAVNRDPAVWGDDAAAFVPGRPPPATLNPWGLSFGSGMHACIGMELDGGVLSEDSTTTELYGTVTLLAAALLEAGAAPDPDRAPEVDPESERLHYSTYPIVFDRP